MRIKIPEKLEYVFNGKARYRGAHGGRGSAKSVSFAAMTLVRGIVRPERILCAREIQNTIRDSVHREIVDAIERFDLHDHYEYGDSFIRGKNGTEFLFKGLKHNTREIKSTAGVTICWVEEAEAVSEESWRVLIPTIRTPGSEIWLTWNPEDEEAATQQRFIEAPPPNSRIVEMNHKDNPWFPPELEAERQHDFNTVDQGIYRHIWEGKTLSKTGLEVYHNFDPQVHVDGSFDYDPSLPILWTHDFNIGAGKPMSSALCQIRKESGKPVLTVFDELILETADTNDATVEFKSRYSTGNVIVYGDASGKARDTRSKKTDYLILADAGFTNQRVPGANPPIRDRHNAVNSLLKSASGEVRVRIHPRCKTVIKGLKTVKIKKPKTPGSTSTYIEEETYWQHVTTAIGYLIHYEFPMSRNATSFNISFPT